MEIKEINFDDLFIFPSINAGITEEFIHNNQGKVPVYGSRKDGKPIGYINSELPLKYFENCITWNRNGSVGYTFYRGHKFVTSDDHRPLYIKDEYKELLDIQYLRYLIQKVLFANGFAWDNKAGLDKMKLLFLPIPIKQDGSFDLEAQKKIAKRYERIEKFQNLMKDYLKTIKSCVVKIEQNKDVQVKRVDLKDIFDFYKGNAKYTSKYFLNIEGKFPIYSGATRNYGLVAYIDTYDWDTQGHKWLTWTTDGVYAGTVFVRNGKFSMNTHCGLLKPKEDIDSNLDVEYIAWVLNQVLPNFAVGDQNKRVTKGLIEEISISIPIKPDGSFDIEEQRRIAKRYQNIEFKRDQAMDMLKRITEAQVRVGL